MHYSQLGQKTSTFLKLCNYSKLTSQKCAVIVFVRYTGVVGTRVGLIFNFRFESAHELLMNLNLNSTSAKSMNLNLSLVFSKSMNLNLVFLKSMNLNLNLKTKNKMNGSNPSRY